MAEAAAGAMGSTEKDTTVTQANSDSAANVREPPRRRGIQNTSQEAGSANQLF